jgi:hypothetical protein
MAAPLAASSSKPEDDASAFEDRATPWEDTIEDFFQLDDDR